MSDPAISQHSDRASRLPFLQPFPAYTKLLKPREVAQISLILAGSVGSQDDPISCGVIPDTDSGGSDFTEADILSGTRRCADRCKHARVHMPFDDRKKRTDLNRQACIAANPDIHITCRAIVQLDGGSVEDKLANNSILLACQLQTGAMGCFRLCGQFRAGRAIDGGQGRAGLGSQWSAFWDQRQVEFGSIQRHHSQPGEPLRPDHAGRLKFCQASGLNSGHCRRVKHRRPIRCNSIIYQIKPIFFLIKRCGCRSGLGY